MYLLFIRCIFLKFNLNCTNCISSPITKVTNLTCLEFHFTFFKSISLCEFVYFEIFVCLILLCEIANIGADLPGAVGANVPIGKGSMAHVPRVKIVKNTIRKKYIHCGQLILRKISKIDATRCHQILRVKCTKFDFRWGSAPDPAGGAYSAPQLYLRGRAYF